MGIQISQIKPNTRLGSGRVLQFSLPGGKQLVTQITTFCPNKVGPGGTHVYLIEDEALVLIDTGLPTHVAKTLFFPWRFQTIPEKIDRLPDNQSEEELCEGIRAAGYALEDIDALVISHGHPDHFMMGNLILEKSKARAVAHILDSPLIGNPWSPVSSWLSRQAQSRAMGMPAAFPEDQTVDASVRLAFGDWGRKGLGFQVDDSIFGSGPLEFDGQRLDGVHVRHLPGHSPGSIGITLGRKEKLLICGDALLFPITPIPDDLIVYLKTLAYLEKQKSIALVLPGHGKIFRNLPARIKSLQNHHRKRLEKCYLALRAPKSVWDVATMKNLFDVPVNPAEFNLLAAKETLSHLELLMLAGGVRRCNIEKGVHYFLNAEEPFEDIYARIKALIEDEQAGLIMRY